MDLVAGIDSLLGQVDPANMDQMIVGSFIGRISINK